MQWLLLPAAFFNGFDAELRALLLPQLQRSFHVGLSTIGLVNVPIGAGQFVAFLLVRQADRIGRRPILLTSLFGYALFTGLTATATSVAAFAGFQFCSQIFIGSEYALAVLIIAEELPEAIRGRALGRLLLAGPLGGVATAALLALGLQHSSLGWRAFYLVGVAPALLVALARPMLGETRAFVAATTRRRIRLRWSAALAPPWRARVLGLGMLSLLEKIPITAGAGWWVYYAEREAHLSTRVVAADLGIAYGIGTLGYYVCGRAIDRFGRRVVTAVFLAIGGLAGIGLFQVHSELASFVLLLIAVFFGLGVSPALSALSAESFPTELRAQASALIGNGFANIGELAGPALVGTLAAAFPRPQRVGDAVSVLASLIVPAIAVVVFAVRETRGARLEAPDPLAEATDPVRNQAQARQPTKR